MFDEFGITEPEVHCRTGSLETIVLCSVIGGLVHCRTGSLEKKLLQNKMNASVHCRTGSLEITNFFIMI